ncbi:protein DETOXIFICATION 45 [Cucumis melo var. makuwa]|uniref:Protein DETOXIFICATION n=1 Tax=Cucumis melo var. makuwa TaxID=1194695 RepID=A0A5D3DI35_CUCMM|nr:protein DETOXIFICATION 45 [Cucumis melo var. makuwa]
MACQVSDGIICSGVGRIVGKKKVIADKTWSFLTLKRGDVCVSSLIESKVLSNRNRVGDWCLSASSQRDDLFTSSVVHRRSASFMIARNQLSSDCEVDSSDAEESLCSEEDDVNSKDRNGTVLWKEFPHYHQQPLDVKQELFALCGPAIAGQAIEPFAQLMETAYIGRLGIFFDSCDPAHPCFDCGVVQFVWTILSALELASAGVSINIFNYISKVFNIPLLSVATSFVAEDISKHAIEDPLSDSLEGCTNGKLVAQLSERKQLSSVSTALLLAVGIGLFEAFALYFGSGIFLNIMGISSGSSLRVPAQQFLSLRALGAPAVVLYLTLQGVFRGIGNLLAVCLFPILIYYCQLGAIGAAISTVISQAVLLPPKFGALQFGVYMKSGGFLLGRTLSVLTTMTLGTSMAARQGAVAMAAHQICMQVWLAVSLLTDALAASSQAMIASSVSKGDYKTAKEVTGLALKVGLFTGTILFAILGASFGSLATLFTKDADVLGIVRTGVLFVSATQPLNSLAFVFDGLHYGVSDFRYAAFSMMAVGAASSSILLYAPSVLGLRGLWLGLSLFMALRTAAGGFRIGTRISFFPLIFSWIAIAFQKWSMVVPPQ